MKELEIKRELTEAEENMVVGGLHRYGPGQCGVPDLRRIEEPRDGGATGEW